MAVDKNLFLHDLAVVAILYNEGHYLKEWLDYHLAAGVDHFYIYDHESKDNSKEILQPYIDAGIVTYIYFPGEHAMYAAYNDAVSKYKYFCRYISFLDGDEFLFPQNNKSVSETLDEIFALDANAGTLAINWNFYGSNYQEKADYSRGVLERFTRRAPRDNAPVDPVSGYNGNAAVKNIANPRRLDFIADPHVMRPIFGFNRINSNGKPVLTWANYPVCNDKIVINHYHLKSREEYILRQSGGSAVYGKSVYDKDHFDRDTEIGNKEFDDGILKYRESRMKMGGASLRQFNSQKMIEALTETLKSVFDIPQPSNIFAGKMETFLTCLASATWLKKNVIGEEYGEILEKAALNAIRMTLNTSISIGDCKILFNALPDILKFDYPVVDEIRKACLQIIPQFMYFCRVQNLWKDFVEMDYLLKMLKSFEQD